MAQAARPLRLAVRRAAAVGLLARGIWLSSIGTAIPGWQSTFGLSLGQVGVATLASSGGYVLTALAGAAVGQVDRRRLLLAGTVAQLLGVYIACLAPSWPVVLLGLATFGAGGGVVDGTSNFLVGEHAGRQRGADLNLVHGFFGLGALAGPLAAAGLYAAGLDWRWLGLPSGLVAATAVGIAAGLRLPPVSGRHELLAGRAASLLRQPGLWLLAAVLGLHVGVQLMLGTWAFTHVRQAFDLSPSLAGLATSLYWGGLALGRLGVGLVGGRITPHRLIAANLAGMVVSVALLVASPWPPPALFGLALAGLAVANVYPAVMTVASARFGPQAALAIFVLSIVSGTTGALVPMAAGLLAEQVTLRWALASALALLLLMAVAAVMLARWDRAGRSGGPP